MVIRPTYIFLFLATLSLLVAPQTVFAHRSGCHNLHTCLSDSDSYVCGDLGYPCNGATRIEDIDPATINVPLLVEAVFRETFGRKPNETESSYWKKRFRDDKESVYQIRRTMAWHAANGSFGPKATVRTSPTRLASRINALFRSVYDGQSPTVSENQYWISRIADKPTEAAMTGAMAWHRLQGIVH